MWHLELPGMKAEVVVVALFDFQFMDTPSRWNTPSYTLLLGNTQWGTFQETLGPKGLKNSCGWLGDANTTSPFNYRNISPRVMDFQEFGYTSEVYSN